MNDTQLMAVIGCSPENARRFAEPLTECMERFSINTPERQAAFLAQVAHESGRLRWVRELADGSAYENRTDLGNVVKGDGTRYKGRGLLQTTGRANYRELKAKLQSYGYTEVPDFEAFPVYLEEPIWAAASAGLYWATRNLNRFADSGDFVTLTKRINGGINGLDDRKACWARAKGVLCPT